VYKGEWKLGNKQGKGLMIYSDGTRYEGAWEDDQPSG